MLWMCEEPKIQKPTFLVVQPAELANNQTDFSALPRRAWFRFQIGSPAIARPKTGWLAPIN